MLKLRQEIEMLEEAKKSKYLFHFIFIMILTYVFVSITKLMNIIIRTMPDIYNNIVYNMEGYFLFNAEQAFTMYRIISIYGSIFIIILVLFWTLKFEKRNLKSLGMNKKSALKEYLIGFLLGVGLFLLVIASLFLSNLIEFNRMATSGFPLMIALFIGFLILGAAFEILLRGYTLTSISAAHNIYLGIIINGLMYVAIKWNYFYIKMTDFNIRNPNVQILETASMTTIAVINIILVSIFLSLYVLKRNNIWGAMAFTASWFIMQTNIFGLRASGLEQNKYSLFYFKIERKEYLTGGYYGLEGGLIVTIVFALAIIGICFYKPKKIHIKEEK